MTRGEQEDYELLLDVLVQDYRKGAVALRTLARGFIRYETMRCLHLQELAELQKRNLAGEKLDDMIDELIVGKRRPQ